MHKSVNPKHVSAAIKLNFKNYLKHNKQVNTQIFNGYVLYSNNKKLDNQKHFDI